MTGFDSKRQMAQAKLDDEADTLTIVYQRGFADGKRSAQQQAEPVQERITHITWDGRGVRTVNGIPDDSPQRKELFASEILNMMPSTIPAEYDGPLMQFARDLEAKLKEKNGY